VADFAGWVHKYNTERHHQGLAGMTPLTRWLADATPIQEIPKEELRWLLLAGERRIIGRDGIHFGGLTFITPSWTAASASRSRSTTCPTIFGRSKSSTATRG
jgi:hypothetical protein